MKTYEVELKRTSYITITIEANSKDEAEEKAWQKIEHGCTDINDSEWDIQYIDEVSQ